MAKKNLFKPIKEFNLSVRVNTCLQSKGIETLYDLVRCSKKELLNSRNIGLKSLTELDSLLLANNLHWEMNQKELRRLFDLDSEVEEKHTSVSLADLEMKMYQWAYNWQQEYKKEYDKLLKENVRLVKSMEDEQLIDANEANTRFGVSCDTIYRWRRLGWLHSTKKGESGSHLYKVKDIKAMIYIRNNGILNKIRWRKDGPREKDNIGDLFSETELAQESKD